MTKEKLKIVLDYFTEMYNSNKQFQNKKTKKILLEIKSLIYDNESISYNPFEYHSLFYNFLFEYNTAILKHNINKYLIRGMYSLDIRIKIHENDLSKIYSKHDIKKYTYVIEDCIIQFKNLQLPQVDNVKAYDCNGKTIMNKNLMIYEMIKFIKNNTPHR